MDAVPVEPVIEVRAECSDKGRAQAALADALAAATGPKRSGRGDARWRVTMRVTAAQGTRSAEAQIRDDAGNVVAERTVSDKSTGTCVPLARAVGAWVQIVLDDELGRAREQAAREPSPVAVDSKAAAELPNDESTRDLETERREADTVKPAPRSAPLEVGAMLFLRSGAAGSSGIAGVSPFVAVGFGTGWLLRPSLGAGTSTTGVPLDARHSAILAHYGARLDLCRRVPGNYIERRGIEFDGCAGADVSYLVADVSVVNGAADSGEITKTPTAFRASVGPSFALRGELAQNVGLEVRGMTGINLARSPLREESPAPILVAAAEIGASVRFR